MASTVLADGLLDGIYFTHNVSNCVYFKTLLKLVCSCCDVVLASPQLLGVTGESGLNCWMLSGNSLHISAYQWGLNSRKGKSLCNNAMGICIYGQWKGKYSNGLQVKRDWHLKIVCCTRYKLKHVGTVMLTQTTKLISYVSQANICCYRK